MNREYGKRQELEDMLKEEKTGTSKDQLRLFERSLVVCLILMKRFMLAKTFDKLQ